MNWLEAASKCSLAGEGFIIVTVLETRGSTPRDCQAKMVVTLQTSHDTIGGGSLEFAALQHAREMLRRDTPGNMQRQFPLGPELAQCCGGQVELLFECFPSNSFHVAVYGAGHVGTALVKLLAELPCRVTWLDSREDRLAVAMKAVGRPANVSPHECRAPAGSVENMPPATWFIVMTHSHDIDFEIVEAVLSRNDAAFCGLIGSRSKAASFRRRLARKGFSEDETRGLTSPIGLDLGGGKLPMEVAVSVAAQLMRLYRHAVSGESEAGGQSPHDTPLSVVS